MNWNLSSNSKPMPRLLSVALLTMVGVLIGSNLVGCNADMTTNGSFDIAPDVADEYLRSVRKDKQQLQRPIVILSGFMDPGFAATTLKSRMKRLFQDERIVSITFATSSDFENARERVIDRVDDIWPSDDDHETVEVDVIAHSMGGLVARYAALPVENRKRLRIARIFTIATPHGGAELAELPTWHKLQKAMRDGSAFLEKLDEAWDDRDYELYPYVRLGDYIIGSGNAAPPGEHPWWVDNPPLNLPHMGSYSDPRIVGDIVRRLRGEQPYTTEPREPIPDRRSQTDDADEPCSDDATSPAGT